TSGSSFRRACYSASLRPAVAENHSEWMRDTRCINAAGSTFRVMPTDADDFGARPAGEPAQDGRAESTADSEARHARARSRTELRGIEQSFDTLRGELDELQ